jgi:hypothetical protein
MNQKLLTLYSVLQENANKLIIMIDLEKLDKEIEDLFERETPDSLTKWLLNKRFGDFNNLIGKGTFIGMKGNRESVFSCAQKANFKSKESSTDSNPINRKAS